MQGRLLWLLLAATVVICGVIGIRGCRNPEGGTSESSKSATAVAPAQAEDQAEDRERDIEAAKVRERIQQHDEALYAAVATLQRYLADLGSGDRAKADAFWAGRRPPPDTHEADLRALNGFRGLRIENGEPKALDSEPVPQALEIPVELRVSLAHGPLRRYRGWYRLRRAVADGSWEITSASVDAMARAE